MKKAILSAIILVSTLPMFGYAQNTTSDVADNRNKAKARIEDLLAKAEHSVTSPGKLNDVLHEFRRDPARAYMTSEDRREISKRLIKIFYSIDETLTNMANKERIVEIIGFSDNSPEAHEFFLKILDSDDVRYREMALWGIRPLGVHGDDLYNKIQSLERSGKISKIKSLQCLADANPPRALEELKNILRTTKSVKEFVRVGVNLPEGIGETPEVLDIIIDRYRDFKGKPTSAEDAGYSPEGAVASERVWKYIDVRDADRLKTALEIIKKKGVCGPDNLPVLEKKIRSTNKETREAVVDFLGDSVARGNLGQKDVLPVLRDAMGRESDHKVRQKIDKLIKTVEKQEGK